MIALRERMTSSGPYHRQKLRKLSFLMTDNTIMETHEEYEQPGEAARTVRVIDRRYLERWNASRRTRRCARLAWMRSIWARSKSFSAWCRAPIGLPAPPAGLRPESSPGSGQFSLK